MSTRARKLVRHRQKSKNRAKATLRTLTILIPRRYNPDAQGARKPVELSKLVRTFQEIRQLTLGYSLQCTEGWYQDPTTGRDVRDRHFRFDIDMHLTQSVITNLREWKRNLERRLKQQSIYMSISKEVRWL